MNSYLRVLKRLCNKVLHTMSLRVHSLISKKILFYVRDRSLPLKTSQKPDTGERTGKRYISYVRLLYVTARPIRVMWQSRRAAKRTQSQKMKKAENKELVLRVHERLFHELIYYLYTYIQLSLIHI